MYPALSDSARIHSGHPMKSSSYPFRRFTAKHLAGVFVHFHRGAHRVAGIGGRRPEPPGARAERVYEKPGRRLVGCSLSTKSRAQAPPRCSKSTLRRSQLGLLVHPPRPWGLRRLRRLQPPTSPLAQQKQEGQRGNETVSMATFHRAGRRQLRSARRCRRTHGTGLTGLFLYKGLQTMRLRQSTLDWRKSTQQLVLGQIGFLKLVPFVSSDRSAQSRPGGPGRPRARAWHRTQKRIRMAGRVGSRDQAIAGIRSSSREPGGNDGPRRAACLLRAVPGPDYSAHGDRRRAARRAGGRCRGAARRLAGLRPDGRGAGDGRTPRAGSPSSGPPGWPARTAT